MSHEPPQNNDIKAQLEADSIASSTEIGTEMIVGEEDLTEITSDAQPRAQADQLISVEPGSIIINNRFVLEERLGKGGQGFVYKARDLRKEEAQDDEPYVAIKFLSEDYSRHPMALMSLQREAKKSQQLAHPNIVTVYDFDRDGDRVYMTMEVLNGTPLSSWETLRHGSDIKATIEALIKQMASGLSYAHDRGVVHSDFKPGNVFVCNDGRLKILDFGIARILDSSDDKDSFDAGDLGAMTMSYASLEMIRGGNKPDPSDDVYALGLVAYKLYTGKHPYGGKNAEKALAEGLSPEPIKDIKRRQWRAIAHAIKLERENRTKTAAQFYQEFAGSKRRNLWLIIAVIIFAMSSAYFGYQASLREGPAVPFNKLPVAVQQEFNQSLELGGKSAAIQDWDGASRYYLIAYNLHPRNPEAEAGLEQLAQHLIKIAPSMKMNSQKQYLLKMLASYSSKQSGNEYLASHEGLNQLKRQLQQALAQ